MEPWLDSLSEDWKSDPQSSSPAPSATNSRRQSTAALSHSQSRIPHLARNIRKDSTSSGSFLRHRSTRGKAGGNSEPILKERSASSLNLPPAPSCKQSSLPRRPSSAFSESQNSVQHYSVREKPVDAETPEWKRRLVQGEDLTSDGFDLFSPSKLEGVFKQPTQSQPHSDIDLDQNDGDSKSWKPFTLPSAADFPQQYSSYRPPRNRLNDLEVLEEVTENEDTGDHSMSAVSSELGRTGSIRGLVQQRVKNLEQANISQSGHSSPRPMSRHSDKSDKHSLNVRDPRWRTISGQEELKNEFISPVTVSKQNSIRETIMRGTSDIDVNLLKSRLQEAQAHDNDRPTSSSSDKDVSYGYLPPTIDDSRNEPLPDLTSQSLPDDLSMGTQDFISHGGFINSRRGGRSNEASFLRKDLSFSQENSRLPSAPDPPMDFHSSPPVGSSFFDDVARSKVSASAPTTPQDSSVIHHTEGHQRPASSGSPLKLFGNRDTYTNNKLMRILSQFEEDDNDKRDGPADGTKSQQNSASLRMSQFGRGDLDGFGFEKNVPRPSPQEANSLISEQRIFKSVPPADLQTLEEPASFHSKSDMREFEGDSIQKQDGTVLERNRTNKRRKTLLREQVAISEIQMEVKVSHLEQPASLAGSKRKDARPGAEGVRADAETLASRSLLRPRSARQRSGSHAPSVDATENSIPEEEVSQPDLTEALAAELASFAQEAADVKLDSRKPSLATKDYMEEANKVMQFIRSRGKPQPAVTQNHEFGNTSELDVDAILDLDLDADSTKDSFTRPPSRERITNPSPHRRVASHDSMTARYLQKYKDEEDLDVVTNTSAFESLPPPNKASAQPMSSESKLVLQESDPPNMRILNPTDTLRKRKYSTSTVDRTHDHVDEHVLQTHKSPADSSQNTFPTNSSTSGPKGVIASGTVSIPDQIGFMTFDHDKKIWIKKFSDNQEQEPRGREVAGAMTEDDPFDSIPDLSVDETRENAARMNLESPVRAQTKEELRAHQSVTSQPSARSSAPTQNLKNGPASDDMPDEVVQTSLRSKTSEHEANLHNGFPSEPPAETKVDRKQARVVTIAFSSPLVSAVNYTKFDDEDLDNLPREEDLPLDDSDLSEPGEAELINGPVKVSFSSNNIQSTHGTMQATSFQLRTISPIEEQDEDVGATQLSLVPLKKSMDLTPATQRAVIKHKSGLRASSILCLTPLSDFSLHQVDSGKDYDQSYVEDRQHPHALRQAHGSLALSVDDLVKAITDAVSDELYWETLRRLQLSPSNLSSAHGLKDYCPVLEELSISGNQIEHVRGLPESLRHLDIHNNLLNDLTSWSSLSNLQYLDVSDNKLENLDGFSSLVHLRRLKASGNNITNIDGILDLDGLLELDVRDNDLSKVDFEGSELHRLQRLDLSHNQLTEARNLQCLPALKDLDLSFNAIEEWLPAESTALAGLNKLEISHNMLEYINLDMTPAIKYLDLDNNRVSHITGLSQAYHLEFLSLREQGKDSNIVDDVLSTPNECRHIRLSSNSVVDGTFRLPQTPQHNLRELEIAACGISSFPENFGKFFPNCRRLNANFNGISDLVPLRGMLKLRTVLLARNRINRMRRTCILLSKLQCLEQIDLRENPLTVGFYSPLAKTETETETETEENKKSSEEARYHLPLGSRIEDSSWKKVLDEVTGLKRRAIELLLTEHCKNLLQLDGMDICRSKVVGKDVTWDKLTGQGVLAIPIAVQPQCVDEEVVVVGQDDGICMNEPRKGDEDEI
ncbi:hypothetical protein PV10_05077 [Exophiala mesophila]|uniref:Septation initiation network scaffold protein cdc11 n=1 Tax=Exophiala mesophila TaxID=212818 RepID=A0A0D1Y071_EXOME|nr:uncharacterized protein PV10_05077 [Exophiala mesophila]KIV93901.1 hypothetical protein PV10_05077 [Exophiala mesophila]